MPPRRSRNVSEKESENEGCFEDDLVEAGWEVEGDSGGDEELGELEAFSGLWFGAGYGAYYDDCGDTPSHQTSKQTTNNHRR